MAATRRAVIETHELSLENLGWLANCGPCHNGLCAQFSCIRRVCYAALHVRPAPASVSERC
eukprot:CAMPEP_0171154692 /NCGR_PEP_ID=MMETSP0790-20130122/471_1 /TAXON_ID=2925 /ORGANISM="Alexandrium catenella, Strain OF101" /LENGTH=60 /DNA_ID=CAMNT_0011618799 /DNA_START=49 /DNA_END=228 /DNA_ORIENTATION=-